MPCDWLATRPGLAPPLNQLKCLNVNCLCMANILAGGHYRASHNRNVSCCYFIGIGQITQHSSWSAHTAIVLNLILSVLQLVIVPLMCPLSSRACTVRVGARAHVRRGATTLRREVTASSYSPHPPFSWPPQAH